MYDTLPDLKTIVCEHALLDGEYTLASGRQSSVYVDLRRVTMHPRGSALIASLLLDKLKGSGVTAVGGMATAAIPIVASVVTLSAASDQALRGFYVREKAKTRGTQRQIEGQLQPGDTVALFEDTMTSGHSTFMAMEAVTTFGCRVTRVITVVDRQQGGTELFARHGIALESLLTLAELSDTG